MVRVAVSGAIDSSQHFDNKYGSEKETLRIEVQTYRRVHVSHAGHS